MYDWEIVCAVMLSSERASHMNKFSQYTKINAVIEINYSLSVSVSLRKMSMDSLVTFLTLISSRGL